MTTADSIAFVINPKSHRVAQKGSWLAQSNSAISGDSILHVDDFDALTTPVGDLARGGKTTFFVEGGDGTVRALLSACEKLRHEFASPPRFAILPGGSTNLAYKQMGFAAHSKASFAKRLSDILRNGRARSDTVQALSVSCNSWSNPQIGFLVSTGSLAGAMAHVQNEFHGQGHRGSLAVGLSVFRFLKAPHRYLAKDGYPVVRRSHLTLNCDAVSYDAEHGMSVMTSLPKLSLGLNPFWGQESAGIKLTIGTWPIARFRRDLLEVLFLKRPKRLKSTAFTSYRSNEIVLRSSAPIMIDGELFVVALEDDVAVNLTDPIEFLR